MSKGRYDDRTLSAIVTGIADVTAYIRVVTLRSVPALSFLPGQYVRLGFEGCAPRLYSIAAMPGQDEFSVHVKKGAGAVSRHIFEHLQAGDIVDILEVGGMSVVDTANHTPLLMIAGGTGVVPHKTVIDFLLAGDNPPPITLYWGTADEQGQYLAADLQDLARRYPAFRFCPVIGTPVGTYALDHERTDDLKAARIYVAGPPPMVAATVTSLIEKGADKTKICFDHHPELASLGLS